MVGDVYIEAKKQYNPFLVFGIGLNIFKNFMIHMRRDFFIIAILSIPIISIYSTGGGINFKVEVASKFGSLTIANLGSDTVKCDMIPHNLARSTISCPYGTMQPL